MAGSAVQEDGKTDKHGVSAWQGQSYSLDLGSFLSPGNGICPSTHDLLQWFSVSGGKHSTQQ